MPAFLARHGTRPGPASGQAEDHDIRAAQSGQLDCQTTSRVMSIGEHLDTSEVGGSVVSGTCLISRVEDDRVSLQGGDVVGGETEQAVGKPPERPRDRHLVADLRDI